MIRAYVDSNVFFYAKIFDKKYGEACARILEDIVNGKIKAVTSTLTILEVANALRKYGLSSEVKNEVDALCSLGMVLVQVDERIVREAGRVFQALGGSPYDCTHIATMRKIGITKILSADKGFDEVSGIHRIDPLRYSRKGYE